ncbi:outer membrane beta-barrel protein [Nonlabens sp. Asnod2-A12]|uniref:outer membrane beta-barrel protein n=1 Tax=Nonlabens sp. Asnod2-A12 TaxID=3160578 RepID=UPI00386E9A94
MSDKKNIDRLFQEGFKDFEVKPPSMVWDNIGQEIGHNKKQKTISLWWILGGVAAGLAILFTFIYTGVDNDSSINDSLPIVNTQENVRKSNDSQIKTETKDVDSSLEAPTYSKESIKDVQLVTKDLDSEQNGLNNLNENPVSDMRIKTQINAPKKASNLLTAGNSSTKSDLNKNTVINTYSSPSRTGANDRYNKTPIAQNNNQSVLATQSDNSHVVNDNSNKVNSITENNSTALNTAGNKAGITDSPKNKVDDILNKDALDSAVAAVDSIKKKLPTLEEIAAEEEKEDSLNVAVFKGKWAASTQVGPVYSNSLSGSAINSEVIDNNRDAGLNLSYGIGLSYEISPRWSVRTGLNQVNMTYSTQDINYQVNVDIASRGQFLPQAYSSSAITSAVVTNASPLSNDALDTGFAVQELVDSQLQGFKGELSQRLGYIEVPLELRYSLINNKFKVNVLGGMSALFLTDNMVTVQNDNQRLELGEDGNFNEFNQSANFGLGLSYDFTSKLGVFIEPTFKYQLSTLRNNVADFKSYTIGVQSGVALKF